ncbi:MAG: hypothetical protein DRJ65_08740 [Acidobacteria bacterium]|nr:MAG: hypothetical protein DRJ65_08740 [Acidobacteriota bacterium]
MRKRKSLSLRHSRSFALQFVASALAATLCWVASGATLATKCYQVVGITGDMITVSAGSSQGISPGNRGLVVRPGNGDDSEALPIAEVVVEQVFAFTSVLRVVEIRLEQIKMGDCLQLEKIQPPIDEHLRFMQDHAEIQNHHRRLIQIRDELKNLRREKDEQPPSTTGQMAELDERITLLMADYDAAYEDLQHRLAGFLNVALNDYPKDKKTIEGLRIYTAEAIVNACEIIETAGDYHKAISILETTRIYYESINAEPLIAMEEKIAEFEEWRYINKVRFDRVVPGMSEREVRKAVGVPFFGNVREDAERGVITWLYKRRDGGAAAIFFTPDGRVYSSRFDEIKSR